MKKSTKWTGILLLLCFLVIGIIGFNKGTSNNKDSTPNKNETTELSITIIGIEENLVEKTYYPYQEETVYDLLVEVCKENNLEITTKGMGPTIYIASIGDLAEFDHGGTSGWLYTVNGQYPQKSAGAYDLEEGDRVEWIYQYE